MKFLRACSAVGITVLLAACGGGSGPSVSEPPALSLQTPVLASQAPTVNLDGTLHVGADVALPADQLPVLAQHDGTSVSHGTVRDGVGGPELIAYLQADASFYLTSGEEVNEDVQLLPDGLVVRFAAMPPTVRVGEDTPPELLHETVLVVQAINAALPRAWQLRFGHEPFPANTPGPLDGEILVTFAPQEDWLSETIPLIGEDIGLAEPEYAIMPTGDPEVPWRIEIVAGRIWVDPSQTTGQERLGVIAHELIHLLGRGHVNPGGSRARSWCRAGAKSCPNTFSTPSIGRLFWRYTAVLNRGSRLMTSRRSSGPGPTPRCTFAARLIQTVAELHSASR